ncbi:hypothetical protein LCGC14_1129030 [marine sediment metagenome]|uniref:Uncharacterized protein n=1 Tax=marine sediment metagenome TaxID=412755 RepID=A0A0F9MPI8_9ZZZZ|nr:hypothetical protein [Methylophaga sp.]
MKQLRVLLLLLITGFLIFGLGACEGGREHKITVTSMRGTETLSAPRIYITDNGSWFAAATMIIVKGTRNGQIIWTKQYSINGVSISGVHW